MEKPPQNFCSYFLKAVKAVKNLLNRALDPDASLNIKGKIKPAIQKFRSHCLKAVNAVKKLLNRALDPDANLNIEGEIKPAIGLCAEMERITLCANVNQTDCIGWTPLHKAVQSNNVKMVAFLLSKGADVNRGTSFTGNTPLHLAAHGINLEIVRLLIDAGADVNRRDGAKMTPLVYACTQPSLSANPFWSSSHDHLHVSFLSELLKAKSCVESRDKDGCTALHRNVRGNRFGFNAKAFELLLSHLCDINARNLDGQSPLYVAAMCNNRKAVLLLLKAGCRVDIGARPKNIETYSVEWKQFPVNLTPVDIAVLYGFYHVAEMLLAAGARINRKVWRNIREELEDGDPSKLERLLAAGAECPKLSNVCRRTFYDHYGIGIETPCLIDKLPLPPLIKMFLTFEIL